MNSYISENLSLSHTLARELLTQTAFPHDALSYLKKFVIMLGDSLDTSLYDRISECVWVAKTAVISPSAYICAPCIIGENTEVRHCAYVRGSVIIGNGCVIGNSAEVKNSIVFDGVQIPHYNYVGDSILGYKAHLGAGAITSNVKSDKTAVAVDYGNGKTDTGRKKLGAIIGDCVEIGCNTVLNPGTVIGKNARVYPLSSVRGFVPPSSIYKSKNEIISIK